MSLVLAALLGALFLLNAVPAAAQTTVWSATLTAKDLLASILIGCDNTGTSGLECSLTSVLTDDDFTHNGVTYDVRIVENTPGNGDLRIVLNKDIPGGFASFTLEVDSSSVGTPSSISGTRMNWKNTGLSWSAGDTISLSLVAPAYTLSIDAVPPCGSSVPGTSMQPTYSLALDPAPAAVTETEYRWVADTPREWQAATASSIYPDTGRSGFVPRQNTFAHWRNTYAGFRGFEFRLKDTHSVTMRCLWTFTEDPASPRTPPSTRGKGTGGGGGVSTPTPTPPPTEQPPTPRCGESDTEDLERFYEATGGERWHQNENWNSQEPLREWHGVDTDEDGNVISLRLADNNLSGDMPTEELMCLSELKELALWGNDDLSRDVPEELMRAVERAVLRDIAGTLDLNPEWFDSYEDPFNFSDWHEGVTTDDEGRVTELDFTGEGVTGEIPKSVSALQRLRVIETGCKVTVDPAAGKVSVTMPDDCPEETVSSSGGGCALSPEGSSAFSLFLLTLAVFAALVRKRAR